MPRAAHANRSEFTEGAGASHPYHGRANAAFGNAPSPAADYAGSGRWLPGTTAPSVSAFERSFSSSITKEITDDYNQERFEFLMFDLTSLHHAQDILAQAIA